MTLTRDTGGDRPVAETRADPLDRVETETDEHSLRAAAAAAWTAGSLAVTA